jgi:hypothetical protein
MVDYLLKDIIDYPVRGYMLNYGIYYPLVITGIVLPFIAITAMIMIFKFKFLDVYDTMLLYLLYLLANPVPAGIFQGRTKGCRAADSVADCRVVYDFDRVRIYSSDRNKKHPQKNILIFQSDYSFMLHIH